MYCQLFRLTLTDWGLAAGVNENLKLRGDIVPSMNLSVYLYTSRF